ncbi:ABC-type polysaccharide/polyol phosphate export systems, permease component [Paludisphaera borealis]|uniref:Transport permease protein n=2 Tax=Paludisphaera borealis TaxID=1387353 RepID=A0A1U7CLU5_9BACT|nr:ABC-type polysaccharide/polyol phosphate export systems, permease component [Paludisphaera borealis]
MTFITSSIDTHRSRGAPSTVRPRRTILQPRSGWRSIDLNELWMHRELLYFLTWRDVKVRYKQTVLGAAWAVLQPLMTMIVFSLFFGRAAGVSSGDLPYPIFVFAGLLPWTFFSNAVSGAGQSVVGSERLITKVYFPRIMIPLSAVAAGLLDFAVASGMLGILMVYYRIGLQIGILLAPLLVLGIVLAAVGVGTFLAAMTVAYRDFRYVAPFLVQLWMFGTPSVYMQTDKLNEGPWRILLPLNPAYGLIANFRSAVLGRPIDAYSLSLSLAVAVVLFVSGTLYFRRVERGFADVI